MLINNTKIHVTMVSYRKKHAPILIKRIKRNQSRSKWKICGGSYKQSRSKLGFFYLSFEFIDTTFFYHHRLKQMKHVFSKSTLNK